MHPAIIWFQQDLRLFDNPALTQASRRPLIALYILDDEAAGEWALGGAQRWWLHHSLQALTAALAKKNIQLVLKRGPALECLREVIKESGADAVYWNRRYEPFHIDRDGAIKETLRADGIEAHSHNAQLLFEPWTIATGSGGYFKVYTPFWKACRKAPPPPEPVSVPKLTSYGKQLSSDKLDDWKLLPTRPDWAGGLRENWQPGEAGAADCWDGFLKHALSHYAEKRDFPAASASSRLSPHLHFGEISVRQIWHHCHYLLASGGNAATPIDKFLSELGWREFCHHLLYHSPTLPTNAFRKEFDAFPWLRDPKGLQAWQRGQTGYPIVDAGMRELWKTGIMHNRVRMVVASFLTKDLLIPWQDGARWFWDTLVDADLASNSANWQWVAGCGADAAPYFRIFNPVLQGQRFDGKGEYVRRWVPEVAALSDKYLHSPWSAPQPPKHYPAPIIAHDKARDRAMEAYRQL